MRFLFIYNTRLPTANAHGLQIAKTIDAVQIAGCRATIILPKRENSEKTTCREYYSLRTDLSIILLRTGIGWLEGLMPALFFRCIRIVYPLRVIIFCLRRRKNFDSMYTRELTIAALLWILHFPVTYEDHEPRQHFRPLYFWIVRHLPAKVAVAEGLKMLYEKVGVPVSSFQIIPNGFDQQAFALLNHDKSIWKSIGIDPSKNIIVYTGHFYPWKGVYTLLDAAREINGQVVLIGGTPTDRSLVSKYSQDLGLTNVTIVPFMPAKNVLQFTAVADILVLPNTAREERSARYTTPLKLFEYLAAGVPIVASNIESFRYYLRDQNNALLVQADQPAFLAAAINNLLTDPAMAKKLGDAGKVTAQKFTWDERARRIIDFVPRVQRVDYLPRA